MKIKKESEKCTGTKCPIQAGFETSNCKAEQCPYRTKPMTNYEYIKTLSVRQMAVFLKNDKCDLCNRCIYTCDSSGRDCEKGILEWLKSESEDWVCYERYIKIGLRDIITSTEIIIA